MSARSLVILLIITTLLLTACNDPGTPASVPSPAALEQTITLGLVYEDNNGVNENPQLLADYLAGQLAAEGITSGEVRFADTAEEMAGMLADGQVDLFFGSVYQAAQVCDQSGAMPIVRGWQFGAPESHAVIFTTLNSGLSGLADLPGHMLVMNSPESTTGFMLPAAILSEQGLTLCGKTTPDASVAPSEVGFVFSGSDENTLQWVLSGYAAAGAVDDYYFDVAFPPEATQKLVILARTESVARQVVVVRPGLDQRLRSALIQALLEMGETEVGGTALAAFQVTRFDEFTSGAEAASQRMQRMLASVKKLPMP